jgi:hypothetical protein
MDKNKIKYVVDIVQLICFITVFITGIIKFPGFLEYFQISSRSIPMNQIKLIHDWSGIIMGILILTHFILNWKWITIMTKRIFSKV